MPKRATQIVLSEKEQEGLTQITRRHRSEQQASWMNQVEIWLSILVRKLLKRGNFCSLDDLRDQVLADHSPITMVRWLNPSSGHIRDFPPAVCRKVELMYSPCLSSRGKEPQCQNRLRASWAVTASRVRQIAS